MVEHTVICEESSLSYQCSSLLGIKMIVVIAFYIHSLLFAKIASFIKMVSL